MSLLEILLISVGLAMDAFAVALGVGSSRLVHGPRPAFRLSFHFGLFQFLMPILGWYIGYAIQPMIAAIDHWIAFGLLVYVGGKMIRAGAGKGNEVEEDGHDPTTGWSLIMLSVATSIDALAVGLSLAMIRVEIWYPSTIIGVVTAGLSLIGLRLGKIFSSKFGKRMEVIGGILLGVIGLRILAEHLFGIF